MSDMEQTSTLNIRLTSAGPKEKLMEVFKNIVATIEALEGVRVKQISMDLNDPKDSK
jgi:hypothetical protein